MITKHTHTDLLLEHGRYVLHAVTARASLIVCMLLAKPKFGFRGARAGDALLDADDAHNSDMIRCVVRGLVRASTCKTTARLVVVV